MREPTRGRRVLFGLVLAAAAYALVEAASFAGHLVAYRKAFVFAEHTSERRAILTATETWHTRELGAIPVGNPPGSVYEVLHPYLGYVRDPTRTQGYSELGFPDETVRILPKDPARVVIGVFGGSFAEGLSITARDVIAERLQRSPRFAGRQVQVFTLAIGGYKQPQQLLALAYLLSLGMHFDIVVTLDGMNDVVLPATDNVPKGTFPYFPRNWPVRIGAIDATMFQYERERANYVDQRRDLARLASGAPWRYSITVNVAWKALDTIVAGKLAEINRRALDHRPAQGSLPYSARGPSMSTGGEVALYDDLASVWMSSAFQMHALAVGNGARYLHFLQPNQYVPGSKEMGPAERAAAFDENHPYRRSVELGYPRLRERGRELAGRGVHFVDLTMALASHREALYTDTCCHLGIPGYRIVAARIADEIARGY